jgi:membrane-associated phospholipid phosphatase
VSTVPVGLSRLAAGVVALAVIDRRVRRQSADPWEVALFGVVNARLDRCRPVTGALAGAGHPVMVPVAAAVAVAAGRRDRAVRLLVSATAARGAARLLKQRYRRPRPGELIATTVVRGRSASGYGYLSSHTAVAVALGLGGYPALPRWGRGALVVLVPLAGLSRIHAGAHLPLDVLGGAAVGLAADAGAELAWRAVGRLVAAGDCPRPGRALGSGAGGSASTLGLPREPRKGI